MGESDSGVENGSLKVVEPPGGPPPRQTVGVDFAGPAPAEEIVVMVATEQGEIVQVGLAAVDPGRDVVPFAPFRRMSAAGEGATAVAGVQRQSLICGSDPTATALVEHRAGFGEHC